MWRSLLRLAGLSGGTHSTRDQYDPVYGLPRRAVEEWLARNPKIREEYEATTLRARIPGTPGRKCESRLRPEPVEEGGGEVQGEEEHAHARDRRQDRPGRQGRVDAQSLQEQGDRAAQAHGHERTQGQRPAHH
jgi:hypothetical protein